MTTLATFTREEFLARRWRYRHGEHVTIIGPTGCGKTVLGWQLLERCATPTHPAVILVKKPRDGVIREATKRLHYRVVRTWPPPPVLWPWWPNTPVRSKPPGYVVWPRTRFDDVQADRAAKTAVFRRTLLDGYRKGRRILVIDDAYGVIEILDLREEAIELWTELRAMDAELWTLFQKPSHVPLWAYSQASHLFLFNDPDKRSRDRFAEIGGVDPDLIRDTVMRLGRHQALYIRRDGPRMCIIDP